MESVRPVFERILLTLSGEALMGGMDYGIDPDYISRIAKEVKAVSEIGVKDPLERDDAVKYDVVSFDEAVEKRPGIMDQTAIVMCRDNNVPVKVFDMNKDGDLMRLVMGDNIGTTVMQLD